ncbi:MAG: hypothetical protein A3G29_17115 [Burkholderiales bacterium RIFCSPLOWO2_12_FULL_64_99]|nr:MAG: hypothetical protein A3E52_06805 [Burkholderiales bacterium RIFCSPHIGHO2_12_FULL_63_20]OGB62106.1 MAG: hypothetical protein A3G29_17115 [Burkholderiales bacterium RIFCSPLOWO2_12_FULL_64_99]
MPPIELKHTEASATVAPASPFTSRDFRDAMGRFAAGVVVITTKVGEDAHAMTATAFMSGSLEPPLVIVSIAHTARMHDKIKDSGVFGVSILGSRQQTASNHFAGRGVEGYAPTFEFLSGVPVLAEADVQLTADVRHSYACGDHTLYVGEVRHVINAPSEPQPLVYHKGRYVQVQAAA